MFRRLGFLAIACGLALPLWSADHSGSISGYVRSAAGVPQMGAVVEVLGAAAQTLRVFTDENGHYSATGLLPGLYSIKVSAASFLPTLKEDVGLRPGARVLVNVTLNTLFEAIKMAPVRGQAEVDDWKWVLRSVSNRPILRLLDDHSADSGSDAQKSNHDLRGSLSLLAGSAGEGFGSVSDLGTGFSLERSIFAADTIGLQGNIGYGGVSPASVLRASYSHKMDNGTEPSFALTMRNLPAPDLGLHSGSLQAFSLTTADSFALGDVVELHFGSELQTIQFLGRVTAFRPFGSMDVHLSSDTVVEYRYATSEPDDRLDKGFDTAPADLSESGPRLSMVGYASALEHPHHHELSLSHRVGRTSLQAAVFYDRVVDPALTGVGEFATDNGTVLPDIYSGTFTYQGSDLKTEGIRLVVQRKLTDDLTATVDFEYGGVLDLEKPGVRLDDAQAWIGTRDRQSIAGKISGVMPKTRTRWIASYRWINQQALTPVDMFNTSAGRADPYLNLFFRQRIPGTGFIPGHFEAVVDLRNLLAEGYVPVLGHDGHTVYLVQSARAVRGGLNFTF
ncbi:MAG: carboxypeptidase-like regulatory domain-containing protein [Terriglobales bacterium]